MQDISDVFHNSVLLIALGACFLAQALKLVVEFAQNREVNWHVLGETGGMPSSHSALVTALAAGIRVAPATPETPPLKIQKPRILSAAF